MNAGFPHAEIDLPSKLDVTAAHELYAKIDAHTGNNLKVNAEHVGHIGGICLQILIAAKQRWADDQLSFEMHNASNEATDFLTLINRADLCAQEAT